MISQVGLSLAESQEECGFSKSILKTPSTIISAWGLRVWMLSIICTTLPNHSKEAEGFLYKIHTKILGALVLSVSVLYMCADRYACVQTGRQIGMCADR